MDVCTRHLILIEQIVLVDKRCSAVHRGVSHDGRFVGGGARDQEPDGDTRRMTMI